MERATGLLKSGVDVMIRSSSSVLLDGERVESKKRSFIFLALTSPSIDLEVRVSGTE
jgi:hypothetical protein